MNLFFNTSDLSPASTIFKDLAPNFFTIEKVILGYDQTFDEAVHHKLIGMSGEDIQSMTLPISLTANPLDFTGFILAHHVRLTRLKNFNHKMPIIFYGSLDVETLYRVNPISHILSTPRVYYVNIKDDGAQKILDMVQKKTLKDSVETDFDFERYLQQVQFPRPSNYLSRHSIANEWAILRWVNMFGLDKSSILDHQIETMLFFKYQEAQLGERQSFHSKHIKESRIPGLAHHSFTFIDDEYHKGWGNLLTYILEHESGAKLHLYREFKKYNTKPELTQALKLFIDGTIGRTDCYIIDLRLHDKDLGCPINEATGYKIIEYIKQKNQGSQIVIFSATNKIWSLQEAMRYKVSQFAVKESPEYHYTRDQSYEAYVHFSRALKAAVDHSFLSKLYVQIKNLKQNAQKQLDTLRQKNETQLDLNNFRRDIFLDGGVLDQFFELLNLDHTNRAVLHQCFLMLHKIIERYSSLPECVCFHKKGSCNVFGRDHVSWLVLRHSSDSKYQSSMELVWSKYPYQTAESPKTITSVCFSDGLSTGSNKLTGIDATTLVKEIAVLYYRCHITEAKTIDTFAESRYLRSNLVAHNTGHVNIQKSRSNHKASYPSSSDRQGLAGRKITLEDLTFLLDLLDRCFKPV